MPRASTPKITATPSSQENSRGQPGHNRTESAPVAEARLTIDGVLPAAKKPANRRDGPDQAANQPLAHIPPSQATRPSATIASPGTISTAD